MVLKKIILTALLNLILLTAHAGHEVGGIILSYKSLASGGNALQYEIKAYALYSLQGISPPSSLNVQITSSCFPTVNKTLVIQSTAGGNLNPMQGVDYCTSSNPPPASWGIATFKGTVVLPGVCSDYRIISASGFGKMNNTNNLSNTFSNDYFYIMLNNVPGPNSSPQIDPLEMYMASCLNKPLNLYNFIEPDGDSIYYSKSVPQYKSGSNAVDRSYNPGYSTANQVGSTAGFNINSQTGLIQTQINTAGNYIITIKFQEYAHDTTVNAKVLVGESRYSYYMKGSTSCYTPSFNMQMPVAANSDSLACGATQLVGETSRKMAISTISADGSDFIVSSEKQGILSVASAQALSSEQFRINLTQSVVPNDTITVYAVSGNDNDVIFSHCGQELTATQDTLTFYTPVSQNLNAAFTYNVNGLIVSFTAGGTSSTADSLMWDFGDGNTVSNQLNPVHTYAMDSVYNVKLILFGECGATDTLQQIIHACGPLNGSFTFLISGDTVFVDASGSVGAKGYIWDFGDGNTGNGINTNHIYSVKGAYQISLKVYNNCGDTVIFNDSIALCASPQAWWTYKILSSSSTGMTVYFDGTASINAQDFEWDFGDGNTNNSSATPTHSYTTPSLTYMVTLSVTNECNEKHSYAYRLNQVSIEELAKKKMFNIFPNPALDFLHIETGSPDHQLKEIKIFDKQGRMVFFIVLDETSNGDIRINLPELSSGVYWISLKSAKGEYRQMLSILK